MFRPQLWRLDLSKVNASRVSRGNPNWDEYRIAELGLVEFEVIVE